MEKSYLMRLPLKSLGLMGLLCFALPVSPLIADEANDAPVVQPDVPAEAPPPDVEAAVPADVEMPSAPSFEEMMQSAQAELQMIDRRLSAAQEQVADNEAIQTRQQELEKLLNERVLAQNPELESVIERSQALFDELIVHPELQNPMASPSQEVQDKIEQYQSLEMQLAGPRQEVLQSEEFVLAQTAFRELILTEMEKIEPETRQLIAQYDALMERMQEAMMRQSAPRRAPTAEPGGDGQ